ncbi:hypothetical protein DWW15_00005, partial [Subdoligranulum sp. AF14-43]
ADISAAFGSDSRAGASPHRNGLRAIQKAPLRRGFSHASASFPHPPTKFCGASFRGVQWHLCFSVCMVSFFI